MKPSTAYFSLLALLFFFSCHNDDEEDDTGFINVEFAFEQDGEGWEGGFAEYPPGEEDFFELSFSHADLPDTLNTEEKGLRLSGTNRSDDLFMFIKRQITGLEPDSLYGVRIDIQLASNAPENSFGIGGSPGGSVYLKAGATTEEPLVLEDNQINIDKGNQAQGGENMMVLGTIGTEREDFEYELISRDNWDQKIIEVRADAEGACWLIVGTDSGFEGTTTLYYNRISILMAPFSPD
ncbi:hypothetical protein [Tunicatimonas pelagia]|uniref:hypothetical protein n=1 Tax=Tunicatimonas pelagia TaxID=931531 RepID=UPI002665B99C|nr:hypothetical protein [Tunicatimonas pelagia]WKN42063.1 hypothetical protein P0M28_23790 [Tunicatimonas pelagia]